MHTTNSPKLGRADRVHRTGRIRRATQRGAPTSPPTRSRASAVATVAGPTDPAPSYSRERTLRAANCLGAHSQQQPARVAFACMVAIVPSVATRHPESTRGRRRSCVMPGCSPTSRASCRSAWTASEEPSCQHARDTRWPTVSHKHGARRASTCAAAAGIPAAGRGQHACTFLPATSASHPCSCLTPPKPGGIAPRRTTVVQLLCSRASKPDVAPWQRLAAMVEAAAGTVGDRPAATGGAADGSETRKLVSEAYAREEILPVSEPNPSAISSR